MKPRTIFLIPALVAATWGAFIGTTFAQSELLTFDDLSGFEDPVPNGYGGLQWNNFSSYNTVVYASFGGLNGDNNGVVSLSNVVFNAGAEPAFISGGLFNLNSAYLMATWNDGLKVEVQGFVGATMTYDNTYTVGTQGSTLITFNYLGVDKVEFISSGGVPHGFTSGGPGTHFAMDNLSVTIFETFSYVISNNTVTITGHSGNLSNPSMLVIPGIIAGLPVVSIGTSAFSGISMIEVRIPNTVTNIGSSAFSGCSSLAQVTLPTGLKTVQGGTFSGCSSLTNVVIPEGVTEIGAAAFQGCTNLTTIAIPASTVSIAVPATWGIGSSPFDNCASLSAINVDPLNSAYSSLGGVLLNEDQSKVLLCPPGKRGNYVIPDSVIVVGDSAFANCSNLANVTIGASVADLGYHAFDSCISLTNITIPDSVTYIQDARGGCRGNCVDGGVFGGCTSLTNVVIGKGLTYLGVGAFSGCSNLLSVYFKGNAPALGSIVPGLAYVFENYGGTDPSTVYYLPGTTGWSSTLAGRPALLWNPQIQPGDASFGIRLNGFGFSITGTSNIPVVIEACINLGAGSCVPLQICTLTNGLVYFSDPQWTNHPSRFYRIRSP